MNNRSAVREIYLAGGCFWGLESYLGNVYGIIETEVGYANGGTHNPTYEDVCGGSGHAETVRVIYDSEMSGLDFILKRYFDVIDPTSVNRQGGDSGVQYRTGIYYTDKSDLPCIEYAMVVLAKECDSPLAVEVKPLERFYPAEDYHQQYLEKNPGGYCHISPLEIEEVRHLRDETKS